MATDAERNRGAGAYSTPGIDTLPSKAPAQIITTQPIVSFLTKGVQPPSPLYVGRDDLLFLRVFNSQPGAQVRLLARLLIVPPNEQAGLPQIQPYQFDMTPTSDRNANDLFIGLAEGFLLDVAITGPAGAFKRGQVFVFIGFSRGSPASSNTYQTLLADYLTAQIALGWPGGAQRAPVEGPGFIHSITGSTPAAGANISEVVPTHARWRLLGLTFTLTTSAAVATRIANFQIDDGVNPLIIQSPNTTQLASLTVRYNVADWGSENALDATQDSIPVPGYLPLLAGYRMRTNVQNIQAADQLSAPQYFVEDWNEI